ncbi:ankyrin repeat domain-containing protein [Pseudomonas nitroreducens]|uniref:ankyrin repeat domain-containing protein n=1 Tax=Pseudomonas nitroreducens TaxID=46680 RepID=UPI002659DC51|nr:ankyrin repeat domain-containing protein [Pseudomonas nitroreducens]MCP1646652.1 ankyrin repeat protein [Pseudomonas nitroreducens]MCP1685228.1 ankyrin repeat protein [Pseudomonas nitroreducens]
MNNQIDDLLSEYAQLPEYSEIACNDPNALSLFGDRPIHVAATRGDIDEIKLLLDHGAQINAKGEHGYTALHDAVEQGHVAAVRYLLDHGADPKTVDDAGFSALNLAENLGEEEIVQVLQLAN